MIGTCCRIVVAMVCAIGHSVFAQQPPAAPAQTPGGVIAGALVSDLAQPVRKAQVTLLSTAPRSSRSTTSDGDGRFEFANLPPGEYTLTGSRSGFLTMVYGARRPGSATTSPGTALKLAAGQKIENIKFTLPRGSVITGVITDEFGDPAFNVPVRAMRFTYDNGRKSLTTGGGGNLFLTDDRGVYRAAGLEPGEYLVSVTPRDTVSQRAAQAEAMRDRETQINAAIPPGGDRFTAPAVNPLGYVPIYYPGTAMGASAVPVRVGPTQEVGNIDIKLQLIQTASVSGTITSGESQIPQTRLQLIDATMPINGVGIWFRDMRKDGTFSFAGLVPGPYIVKGFGTVGGQPGMAGGDMWGTVDVSADSRNAGGVTLRMQRGVSVSGRIALEGLTPADVARVRVSLQPVLSGTDWEMGGYSGTPDAEGKFTFEKVLPVQYRPNVTGLPEGWALASAIFEERDAADVHLAVDGSRNIAGGEWKLRPRTSEVTGVVTMSSGAPSPDHTVLLFPSDIRMWVPQSRRIQVARPGPDGRFTLRNLPPGEYRIATLLDPEPGQWQSAEFLAQMLGLSITITLAEGERRTQDLRVR